MGSYSAEVVGLCDAVQHDLDGEEDQRDNGQHVERFVAILLGSNCKTILPYQLQKF